MTLTRERIASIAKGGAVTIREIPELAQMVLSLSADRTPFAWFALSDDGGAIRYWTRDEAEAKSWSNYTGVPIKPLYAAGE